MKEKILLVDDDSEIREIITVLLESENYKVIQASNGANAIEQFDDDMDLVILDIMMPGMSGYQVCHYIRGKSTVPILFLTAKSQESDLTLGFSSGGDDYLAKPFSYVELIARVKGLLRRYCLYMGKPIAEKDKYLIRQDLRLNSERNEVWKADREVNLTEKEYQVLRLMMLYSGKIFSAQNIYESVWEEPYFSPSSNTVMVHIRKIREKIEDDPRNPQILITVWGKGYRVV